MLKKKGSDKASSGSKRSGEALPMLVKKEGQDSSHSGTSRQLRSGKRAQILNAYDEVQELYVDSLNGGSSSGSGGKKSSQTGETKETMEERRFANMKPEEKKACFDNLAKEIKVMRRKFTRFNKSISKKKEQEATAQKDREFLETCFRAQQILKETTFEMPDQAHVIENLTKIINNGSLALDSLEFYQICSLVRKVMKKQKNKDAKVPLTMKEHLFFATATREDIIEFFTGRKHETIPAQPQQQPFVPPQTMPYQYVPMTYVQIPMGSTQPFMVPAMQAPNMQAPMATPMQAQQLQTPVQGGMPGAHAMQTVPVQYISNPEWSLQAQSGAHLQEK